MTTNKDRSYDDGFDPEYGYNRNAFKHKTPATWVLEKAVQAITLPIDISAEAIAHAKGRKRSSPESRPASAPTAGPSGEQGDLPKDIDVRSQSRGEADTSIQRDPALETGEGVTTDIFAGGIDDADRDDVDWELDDAVEKIDGADIAKETSAKDAIVQQTVEPDKNFMRSRDDKPLEAIVKAKQQKLQLPVILPQRRPGTKTRGFVRAYAPLLAASDITQEAFLHFLKSLHDAAQASPVLRVIQLGAAVGGFYPDIIVASVLQAVQITAGVVEEMQERWRTNRFLDQANKELFMPRGLYAMVIAYKPTLENEFISTKTVDMRTAEGVAKFASHLTESSNTDAIDESITSNASLNEHGNGSKEFKTPKEKIQNRLHLAGAETLGEAEMPVQCAPLIYPTLEAEAIGSIDEDQSNLDGLKNRARRGNDFVNDYLDRRARMLASTENPNSALNQLAGGKPTFKSKFGDPNDGRNKHLITLITGGKIKAEPLGARRRWEKAQAKEKEQLERRKRERIQAAARGEHVGPLRPKKRFLKEDVLYLAIVNMPSDAELSEARKALEERRPRKSW